jgi:hypothetical protein
MPHFADEAQKWKSHNKKVEDLSPGLCSSEDRALVSLLPSSRDLACW